VHSKEEEEERGKMIISVTITPVEDARKLSVTGVQIPVPRLTH
jgi:hypothetical protein